ncbi:MAG: hypothetical protein E6K81_16215 [Candidatus Eisenbacteria bacterium]|uniref:Uncharacterized protein n=1 Tax=Eiseniibacteriota bacterium TaxID=2212470 RepID=A0A538TYX1_UNCEI|nr:MAG: hypothetical protein E6K81_16215 [Candidatus Eisenbacteria bacterium]
MMSAARRFALLLVAASIAVAITATTVLAQGAAPNPSGGTSAHPAAADDGLTPVAITPATFLSAGFPLDLSLRGWLTSQIAMQRYAPITRTAVGRILARRAGR